MRYLLGIALLSFAIVSCSNNQPSYQAEIAKVDSLITDLNNFTTRYNLIDAEAIESEIGSIEAINKVLHGPKADQENKVYWTTTLAPFELVITPYQKFLRDKAKIEEKLNFSQKQLLSLRKSLEDAVIDSSAVDQYLLDEEQALGEIYMLSIKRIEPTLKAQAIWDSSRTRFTALSDSIAALPEK